MTGTPIMSRPDDLYGIVSIKDKRYFGGSYAKFEERYLVKSYGRFVQVVGYKNLDELREKTQRLILRRTSNEVAIDLPETLEIDIKLKPDQYQTNAKDFVGSKLIDIENLLEKYKCSPSKTEETRLKIEDLEAKLKGFIAIEQIIANSPRLFHYSKSKAISKTYEKYTPDEKYVSSKYSKLLDIVEEAKEAGEKVIVFTKYETVVKHLCDYLKGQKIKAVPYYGAMNQEKRDENIKEFKYNDTVSCIILTDAGAEGINLNNSSIVINFDQAYNQAIYRQRIGRSRRVGSKHKVTTVYNLLTEGTIDMKIFNKMKETKRDFDTVVGVDNEQSKVLKALSN